MNLLIDNAGWIALLAGVTSILAFLALFIFFAGAPVFGPINDVLSVFQMLFLVPTILAFILALEARASLIVIVLTAGAALAALAIAVMQILLVLGRVGFGEILQPILLLGIPMAVWWITSGALAVSDAGLPRGLGWWAIVSGVGFAVAAVGYLSAGPMHPLTAAGFLLSAVGVPVWSIWLGRMIMSGRISLAGV